MTFGLKQLCKTFLRASWDPFLYRQSCEPLLLITYWGSLNSYLTQIPCSWMWCSYMHSCTHCSKILVLYVHYLFNTSAHALAHTACSVRVKNNEITTIVHCLCFHFPIVRADGWKQIIFRQQWTSNLIISLVDGGGGMTRGHVSLSPSISDSACLCMTASFFRTKGFDSPQSPVSVYQTSSNTSSTCHNCLTLLLLFLSPTWARICKRLKSPGLSYRAARLNMLAKSIPCNRLMGALNVYKFGL
jgi:hypothetical protein